MLLTNAVQIAHDSCVEIINECKMPICILNILRCS